MPGIARSARTGTTVVRVIVMAATVISAIAGGTPSLLAQSRSTADRTTAGSAPPASSPTAPAAAATSTGFAGIWLDDTGDGAVEIKPCGPTAVDQYCGSIYWLKKPNDKGGKPLRDGSNEDVKERQRPICGMPTIGGLKRQPSGQLDEGWIYDPRRGQRFDLELTLKGPDKLQVVGYKGFKMLSKTFIWTRAPATVTRCQSPS